MITLKQYYRESGLSIAQVIFTQAGLLFSYIALILLPLPSKLHLVTPIVPVPNVWSVGVATHIAAVIILIMLGVYLLRKRFLSGFGILFFITTLIPESILVPQYLFVVYRAAFPMIGILLILAELSSMCLSFARSKNLPVNITRIAFLAAAVFPVTAMGLINYHKAHIWSDPVQFWSIAVRNLPPISDKPEINGTAQVLNSLGVTLQSEKKFEEALDLHQKAMDISPKHVLAYSGMGSAYRQLGRVEDAKSLIRNSFEIFPKNPELRIQLAEIYMAGNASAEAEELYKRAVELAPNDSKVLDKYAQHLVLQNRSKEALSYLQRSLEIKPNRFLAHYLLGKVYMRSGQTEKALSHFARALNFKPDSWESYNDIGVLLATNGKQQEAVSFFKKALEINPNDGATKANLATAIRDIQAAESN